MNGCAALSMNAHLHKFEKGQRRLIPTLIIVCFAFLNVAALPLLQKLPFSFGLAEAAIFYWALLHPVLVPYWLLFLVGMLMDSVTGGMFGLHAVSFMLIRLLTARARLLIPRHNLPLCTLGFAIVYGVACCISLLIVAYFSPATMTAAPVIAGWVASVGIFPILALFFHRIFRAIISRKN